MLCINFVLDGKNEILKNDIYTLKYDAVMMSATNFKHQVMVDNMMGGLIKCHWWDLGDVYMGIHAIMLL